MKEHASPRLTCKEDKRMLRADEGDYEIDLLLIFWDSKLSAAAQRFFKYFCVNSSKFSDPMLALHRAHKGRRFSNMVEPPLQTGMM